MQMVDVSNTVEIKTVVTSVNAVMGTRSAHAAAIVVKVGSELFDWKVVFLD